MSPLALTLGGAPETLDAELLQKGEAEAKAEAEKTWPGPTMFTDGPRPAAGYTVVQKNGRSWVDIKTHMEYSQEAYDAECAALARALETASRRQMTPERITIFTDEWPRRSPAVAKCTRPGKETLYRNAAEGQAWLHHRDPVVSGAQGSPRKREGRRTGQAVGIYVSIKGEDCITALCGRKISLYTGRPSGQRTEDCPPSRCSGTQSCPDVLKIMAVRVCLRFPILSGLRESEQEDLRGWE